MQHLTLEQCKNLREWGFPQNNVDYIYYGERLECIKGREGLVEHSLMVSGKAWYACPNLEELIDWLPKYFEDREGEELKCYQFSLSYAVSGNCWFAHYERYMHQPKYTVMGETPLEAVYNLAKAIHER